MIGIASDHGGFVLKQYLLDKTLGFSKNALSDFGCYNLDSVDYPIYGHIRVNNQWRDGTWNYYLRYWYWN